ncbi:MAG: indole-3-glycerol phosphate synthase TrpC [Chloroflexota bacterium]|nr:indole-3-glycerol phosphate synthase TrpC [Chloroflexota bacterium]
MSGVVETGTVLDRILARSIGDLKLRKAALPLAALERRAEERPAPVNLRAALSGPGIAVIAEVKRASPSRGAFPVEVDPEAVAAAYLAGGAVAVSVLTDEPFFRGSLADLEVAAAVAHAQPKPAPVLRKDFVVDPYQVVEARASGADAVLLIVAALDDTALGDLLARVREAGMEALVEVHDEAELARAAAAGASVIGVNNRDLRSFEVDLGLTERLAPLAPAGTVLVGESGIFSRADVERLERAGVDAVLVGEGLVTAPDRAAAVRALRGEAV